MVITKDQAWLSTIREVRNGVVVSLVQEHFLKQCLLIVQEEAISDPEQLLERVLAFHDARIENGQYRDT